ncbi:MAG: hypothetical protein ACK5SZ_02005, partial [bacterium]
MERVLTTGPITVPDQGLEPDSKSADIALPPMGEREAAPTVKAESIALNFHYGAFHALKSISMPIYERKIT